MRIDVHAHYFPDDYLACIARLTSSERPGNLHQAPLGRASLDERVELLNETGVAMQVLSVSLVQPYLPKSSDAATAARLANDLYVDACRKYKGRFAAFGAVPLPHVDAALAETERCLDTLGMVGLTVGTSVAGRPLDDPEFGPFFAELDRRGAVLFLHPMGAGCGPGSTDYGLIWMIGAPIEDSVAAMRLVLSGMTRRYPRIRVIVPHLGGVLPFLLQRLDDARARQGSTEKVGIDEPPSHYVKRMWFDTVNSHPAALRCACESFGADRLMLGTDFPYLDRPRFKRCVTYIEDAGFSSKETAAILGGNAQALLGLG